MMQYTQSVLKGTGYTGGYQKFQANDGTVDIKIQYIWDSEQVGANTFGFFPIIKCLKAIYVT